MQGIDRGEILLGVVAEELEKQRQPKTRMSAYLGLVKNRE
jgi:hypothetical protein